VLNQLAIAESDGLTGTRARATGLEHIDREIERARRTMAPLVVAYVDVVGLKAKRRSRPTPIRARSRLDLQCSRQRTARRS
jgi:hypothetical protein